MSDRRNAAGANRWRAPRLRVGEEGRHATWLELFFDLVFVVAIAALAGLLHDRLTPGGFLAFAALFVPVGWVWMSFAYYADQYDTDDALFRLCMLAAMLASAVLAVSLGGALGSDPTGFVLANVALRVLLVLLYAWAWRSEAQGRSVSFRFARAFGIGAGVWLVSLFVPEPFRYALWAGAILFEMATPIVAYARYRSVPGHASHMPERFGLFTILVLGESIVILAASISDADWRLGAVVTATAGFAVAACLWWIYFDRVDEEAIGQSFSSGPAGVVKSHVWGYGHLPLWAGLATASIGAEFAILEAVERGTGLSLAVRVALLCGAALYLLALTAIQWSTPTSLDGRIMAARLLAAAGAVLLVPLGAPLNPPLVVGALALLLAVLTAAEAGLARPEEAAG